jgi:hypothetical protein
LLHFQTMESFLSATGHTVLVAEQNHTDRQSFGSYGGIGGRCRSERSMCRDAGRVRCRYVNGWRQPVSASMTPRMPLHPSAPTRLYQHVLCDRTAPFFRSIEPALAIQAGSDFRV